MRVQIESTETHLNLHLPTGLMCSRLLLKGCFSRICRTKQLPITASQAEVYLKFLRQYRKTHPDWVLVEIESADGERVRITV